MWPSICGLNSMLNCLSAPVCRYHARCWGGGRNKNSADNNNKVASHHFLSVYYMTISWSPTIILGTTYYFYFREKETEACLKPPKPKEWS